MTAATSENLAKVLESVGLFGMAAKARLDTYHDFLSPLDFPEMQLEADLRQARDECPDAARKQRIEDIRQRHIRDGEFDASKEESDEWAGSEEGKDAFKRLIRGE